MVPWSFPAGVEQWIIQLSRVLHQRLAWRLLPLLVGVVLAQGRRTVSSWLRAADLGKDYQDYYYFLGSLGRKSASVASSLFAIALQWIGGDAWLLFALDDTPTKRYGPKVQGAGIHHNPTPGPAGQEFVYGHVWVTLAWLVRHPAWGTIGLPLRALLYVRQKDIAKIPQRYGVKFETKLVQAASLVKWLAWWAQWLGKRLRVVVDGAYAKRPFVRPVLKAGVVIFSRLRKDAALSSLPPAPRRGQRARRGRPAKYGKQSISLAKRAAHRGGWQHGTFVLYGKTVTKQYKTFLATYRVVGGVIRVVLVREDDGSWRAYFSTDPELSVATILEAVADRAAIEQNFHDLKEVHGVGQQQVRNYWVNVAVYHVNLWMHTLLELWAWRLPAEELCDRQASPWDQADRRPSHADRRKALRRWMLANVFSSATQLACDWPKILRCLPRLMNLAA